jgi:hypothetical protein
MVLAAATTLTATLLAGGCASRTSPGYTGTAPGRSPLNGAPSAPMLVANDCADFAATARTAGFGATQSPGGVLPADVHPVSLLKCSLDNQDVPGQGQWLVVTTIRSTGSVDGFVSALRAAYVKAPQPTPKGNFACADVAYVQPWVALVDAAGKAYRVEIPIWGVCPAPDPDVMKALGAVATKTVATERIQQTMSPGAQASGCVQQFAEMAFVDSQSGTSGASRPFFPSTSVPAGGLRVCYYKITGTYDKQKPAGDFEAAATITGSQAAAVYEGLMNAPVATAKTCDAPATEYAVIFDNASGGAWSVVELGGCKLASPDSGADRQAPAAVVQTLLAAKKH